MSERVRDRQILIEYFERCAALNYLDNGKCKYNYYEYYYKDKKLYLTDILGKAIVKGDLKVSDAFDVWEVDFGKAKFSSVRTLDLSYITSIKSHFGGSNLKRVIANHVKVIPELCFAECEKLEEVSFNHCISIKENAFESSGVKVLHLESVKYIGSNAFSTSYLEEIFLGDTDLSEGCFSDCNLLKKIHCKSSKFMGATVGFYDNFRRLECLDIGIFYDNKKYFFVRKLEDALKITQDTDKIKRDTEVYEKLYGKLPNNKVAVRNYQLTFKRFNLKGGTITLELAPELIQLGLSDYYLDYFSHDYHRDNINVTLKIGNNLYHV
jgi:hypothetical protein